MIGIDCEKRGRTLIVRLEGELDLRTAGDFRARIEDQLRISPRIRNILLDLGGLDFIDSSGLGAILGRYRELSQDGGRLAVININRTVERIFSLSGLFRILERYAEEEQALSQLE